MRVLSGIQPSGQLHIGNYFGSMKPNLEFASKAEQSFYMIVDLHALTTVHDAKGLKKAKIDAVKDCLAVGFDPHKSVLFAQSDVKEHTELAWILGCVTPMGLLERAVSFKEKVQQGIPASVGLFTYPVLMAADILLYKSTHVPVGKDQKQHVEMARDIAQKFNHVFGKNLFPIPEPVIQEKIAVVRGTDGRKMSKSYGNTIPIFGDEKTIKKLVMGMVTDSAGASQAKDPEKSAIFAMHELMLSQSEAGELAGEYKSGISYSEAKKRLFERLMDYFGPMRERRSKITDKDVGDVLSSGRARAEDVAVETMEAVGRAVGL